MAQSPAGLDIGAGSDSDEVLSGLSRRLGLLLVPIVRGLERPQSPAGLVIGAGSDSDERS